MDSEKIEIYITKNTNLAAYLCCFPELKFTGATKVNAYFFFKFTPKNKAEELVNQYFAGNASVNPRELFARLHDLKDLIFSEVGK